MSRITEYTSSLSGKWITFAIGCLQSISNGPLIGIAACTADIKNTFNMTENQYGLIAALYLMGNTVLFPPGYALDRYGPVLVSTFSLILTLLSHGAISLLATFEPFPAQKYLLYVSFFCGGLSFSASITVQMTINLSNFHKSGHGKVCGVFGLFAFLGASIFNELYVRLISPNLSAYFLIVAIFSGIVCILMVLFVRRFNSGEAYVSMESEASSNNIVIKDELDNESPWKKPELYILLMIFLIAASCAHVLLFMVASFTQSLGLEKYTTSILSMATISTAVSILLIGIVSDYVLNNFPRMYVALIPTIAQTVVLFIAIFEIEHIEVLVLLLLINSVSFANYDTIIPSELHECVGDDQYGTVYGIFFTIFGFSVMGLEYFTTWFYEDEGRKQESPDKWCHGKVCLLPMLILMFILYVIAVVLIITYQYRRRKRLLGRCNTGNNENQLSLSDQVTNNDKN